MRSSPTRRGVALVIALVTLAALLALALPFLFSQTASQAGAGSAVRGERAERGLASSEQLGAGVAARAHSYHLSEVGGAAPRTVSDLQEALVNDPALVALPWVTDGKRHVIADLAKTHPAIGATAAATGLGAATGLTISDEEAKLDPSSLSLIGWGRLFAQLGIIDPPLRAWTWGVAPAAGDPPGAPYPGATSPVQYGLLALTLVWLREISPDDRFISLDDLFRADPEKYLTTAPGGGMGGTSIVDFILNNHWLVGNDRGTRSGARDRRRQVLMWLLDAFDTRRAPLTKVELARLSAWLSSKVPPRARGGVIDVGTLVERDANVDTSGWLSDNLRRGREWAGWVRDQQDALYANAAAALHIGKRQYPDLFKQVLNLNDPGGGAFTGIHDVPDFAWFNRVELVDGRGYERPPVSLTALGIVALAAAAQAEDRRGAVEAERSHRTIVQAVPQELPLEVRWRSQAEYEALVRAGHGSWVVSAPRPGQRIIPADLPPTDFAEPGWLEPEPLGIYGENFSNESDRGFWMTTDWYASFGLVDDKPKDEVLKDNKGRLPDALAPPDPLDDLTSQGLRVGSGGLAWRVIPADGPLKATARGASGDELDPRRLALWFALSADAPADGIICEARRGADDDRDLWQVRYRLEGGTPYLVLALANAAKPWPANSPMTMRSDNPATADVDEGCLADTAGKPLAPLDPAARVEFRYRLGGPLVKDRWYHLQVLCAGDRPGSHLLVLDGIVGRDAIEVGEFTQAGDHYTFPSLRLAEDIPYVQPTATNGVALVQPATLRLLAPPKTSGGGRMALSEVLPARGLVRIDDEWFRYEGIAGDTLTGVQRGRRQNTDMGLSGNPLPPPATGTTDDPRSWPVVQGHKAGAVVTPGWTLLPLGTGDRLLYGDCSLNQEVPETPKVYFTASYSNPAYPLGVWTPQLSNWYAPAASTVRDADGRIVSFSGNPSGDGWAERGYCWVYADNGAGLRTYHHGAYRRDGGDIALEFAGEAVYGSGRVPGYVINGVSNVYPVSGAKVLRACPTSFWVDGEVAPMADGRLRFAPWSANGGGERDDTSVWLSWSLGGAIQLMDPDGNAEWIRCHEIADRDDDTPARDVRGKFLVNFLGFPHDPARPAATARASMRTKLQGWIPGDPVLPVQTMLPRATRLESGDVVTIVPQATTGPAADDPPQLLVRQAARDGFPAARSQAGAAFECVGSWFAFDQPVPTALPDPGNNPAQPTLLVVGRGWGGRDLSPVLPDTRIRRGLMPTAGRLAAGADARLTLLSADPRGSGTAMPSGSLVDDMQGSAIDGIADANEPVRPEVITGIFRPTGALGFETADPGGELTSLGASLNDLPVVVTADRDLFAMPGPRGNSGVGLVWINGEVFAFRRVRRTGTPDNTNDSRQALLIGRGLLGSAMRTHAIPAVADAPTDRRPGLPALVLPIGPVAELVGTLPAAATAGTGVELIDRPRDVYDAIVLAPDSWDEHTTHLRRAPYHLICSPDGSSAEMTRLLERHYSKQVTVAPWLRGLYGTTAQTWQPTGALNPLVIGWYPRFAATLPRNLPSGTLPGGGTQTDALLRSRSLAWAGFPIRWYGMRTMRLDRTATPAAPMPITALAAAGGPAQLPIAGDDITVQIRALATNLDPASLFAWGTAPPTTASLTGGTTEIQAVSAFAWAPFLDREIDGAEMRVHWAWQPPASPPTPLLMVAEHQGRILRIGQGGSGTILRCMAPVRVLAVEGLR